MENNTFGFLLYTYFNILKNEYLTLEEQRSIKSMCFGSLISRESLVLTRSKEISNLDLSRDDTKVITKFSDPPNLREGTIKKIFFLFNFYNI